MYVVENKCLILHAQSMLVLLIQ